MKNILVVGTSFQSARNLALDIIESRNEKTTYTNDDIIRTDAATYLYRPHFRVTYNEMRGRKFDEVHMIGNLSATEVDTIREATFNSGIDGVLQKNYITHSVEDLGPITGATVKRERS